MRDFQEFFYSEILNVHKIFWILIFVLSKDRHFFVTLSKTPLSEFMLWIGGISQYKINFSDAYVHAICMQID